MPCSAVSLDYRSESTAMPVPTAPIFETELSRPKYSSLTSSYTRRTSTSSKQPYASDIVQRYTSPTSYRSGIVSRSTSLISETRDRSQTRDYMRSARDSPRLSYSNYSSDSSKSYRKQLNYTSSDLNDFFATYAPSNYTIGTLSADLNRTAKSGDISRVRLTVAKEKRSEPGAVNNLEVNRDENHNVTTKLEEKQKCQSTDDAEEEFHGEGTKCSTEVKVNKVDESKDSGSSGGSDSSELQENYSPRLAKTAAVTSKKESLVNSNNGLSGLRNIGNTCFLNSVVQCLSNTRILKDFLCNKDYVAEITNSDSKGVLIKSFADVISELWSGEGKVVNTTAFKAQIQKYAPRFMGYNQQDAQEFLRYLLQGLHDDINRITSKPRNFLQIDDNLGDSVKASESWKQYLRIDNSRIVDLFVGQLKSTLQCTFCGHCSTTFEVFWDLSLPLPSRTGSLLLSQCLDHFTKEEVLDGDEMPTCSSCKARKKCTKRFSIQKFPKILVLHLKRFSPSERYRKLSATVEFPLTGLDMSAYSSTPQACSYNLYAVSNHSGTAYSGHYTAYCLHPHSNTWHEYNDSRVTSVSSRNVVSSEAYILFYEQTTGVTSRL